jgi:hypothetical protein
MKICPVAAELFPAGGGTYMTKLMVAFRTFVSPPKIDDGRRVNEEVEGGDIFQG